MQNVELQADQAAQLAGTFGLLADPTRLSIVLVCMDREIPAGDIADDIVTDHDGLLGSGPARTGGASRRRAYARRRSTTVNSA